MLFSFESGTIWRMALRVILVVGVIAVFIVLAGCGGQEKVGGSDSSPAAPAENQTEAYPNDWSQTFSEHGFSDEEIAKYETMLNEVGITFYHDVDIIENGIMHIVRGKIYDSKNLQLNITLENREIIYIALTGIPATKTEAYINWRGKLKFQTSGTTKSVDLYSDTAGGYLARMDWETMTIVAIEE